jgi:hypothetical protein
MRQRTFVGISTPVSSPMRATARFIVASRLAWFLRRQRAYSSDFEFR